MTKRLKSSTIVNCNENKKLIEVINKMKDNKVYLTDEGFLELEEELNELKNVKRPEVIKALKEARALGDLSENADYDAARDRQARVEARIRELEAIFLNIEIIDEKEGKNLFVKLGAKVSIVSKDGYEETYTIVSSVEADPLNGKLSNVTPLAVALMDRAVSDEWIEIEVEPRESVKITAIE